MKLRNNLFKILICSLALIFGSCSDFLEEKVYDFVAADQLGEDIEAAKLLTNGAVATLNEGEYFRDDAYTKGQEFDTDDIAGGDWAMGGYGSGNFINDWFVTQMWTGRYALIYRCNKAINLIGKMSKIGPDDQNEKNNCLGQLYFLKAWAYFQLVRAYGPVPMHKELVTDVIKYNKPRSPISEVYSYIIEQLKLADNNLYDKRDSRYQIGRISKYAAKTLLAQVYVTMASASMPKGTGLKVYGGPATKLEGDKRVRIGRPIQLRHAKVEIAGYNFDSEKYYRLAKDLCDSIINYGGYELYDRYMDAWSFANRNGKETIWALQAAMSPAVLTNGTSTSFAGNYFKETEPQMLKGAFFGCRQHWYELFEEEDARIKDGVVHRYAIYYKGGTGPDKNDPWWFYYPMKDSTKVRAEDPYFGYKKSDWPSDLHAILRKFEAVSDRKKEMTDFHYPFLRYPAVYLMKAEAECELGNVDAAKAAVDVVRKRAHASLVTGNAGYNDKEELRSFILEERRRELALEGNRKWDLLRWGVYVQVMSAVDIDEYKCIKRRQERHMLMPIPLSELNANDSINVNNPGW